MSPEKRRDGDASPRYRRRKSETFRRKAEAIFLREAPARVEALWSAGRAGDSRGVAIAAHTLKCLAANLDARSLHDLAGAAEAFAEAVCSAPDAACMIDRARGRSRSAIGAAVGGQAAPEEGEACLADILFDLEIAYAEICAGLQRPQEKSAA